MVYIKINYSVTDVYISGNGDAPVYIKVGSGDGGASGTVTSVDMTVPTGLTVSGNPITSSGTLAVSLASGYVIPTQATLDGKVPYSGATGNVDLGEYELKAGQIEFDQSPTGTAGVAVTRWNDTIGSTETTLKGGSVILKNGVDLVARVVNKVTPNATLTKAQYQAVRVTGAQGQRLAVAYAQANNDNNSADTIGLVIETIPTNQEGFIMTVGSLEGINTTGSLQGETWSDGDVLYLSPTTPGALTNVKPVAPQHIIVIGYVEYAHANNGKIYVKVMNGWELGELHDVNTAGATNGQVLAYNGSIWVPTTNGSGTVTSITASAPLTGGTITSSGSIGITQASGSADGYLSSTDWTTFNNKQNALTNPITGSAASGQVAYFTGATTQAGSNNLFWDNTNARLGVGTNAPTKYFELKLPTGVNTLNNGFALSRGSGTGTFVLGNATSNINDFVPSIYSKSSVDNAGFYFAASVFGASSTFPAMEFQAANSTNTGAIGNSQVAVRFTNWTTQIADFRGNGNVLIGGTTDSGQRLQVQGDAFIKGSGNTSGSTALTVQNSDGTNLLRVRNDLNTSINYLRLGNSFSTSPYVFPFTTNAGVPDVTGTNLSFYSYTGSNSATNGVFTITGDALTQTSGNHSVIYTNLPFTPTSGTATFSSFRIIPVINQTGGANGITRGLYVQPTLTAAADWRSIEWSNNTGWGLYGAGTANNYLAGNLGIGTNAPNTTLHISPASGDATFRISTVSRTSGVLFTYGNTSNVFSVKYQGAFYFINQAETVIPLYLQSNGNVGIATTTDAGFRLDINGTARVQDDLTVSKNQNAATRINLTNTTSDTNASAVLIVTSSNGNFNFGKYSALRTPFKTLNSNDGYIYNASSGDISILNDFITGRIKFAAGGSSTVQMELNSNGQAYFYDNLNVSKNHNGQTVLTISNTTAGTSAQSNLTVVSETDSAGFGKFSSTTTTFKIIAARDNYIYNAGLGDIAIFNGAPSGKIKFATGNSSTVQMEIASNGTLTSSASATASGAIARGANFTPTLTAAANNDVLVGLDINPTFTNGAFTGVTNYAIRTNGIVTGTHFSRTGVTNNLSVGMFDGTAIAGAYMQFFGNNFTTAGQRGGFEVVFDTRNSGTGGYSVFGHNGTTWTRYLQVFTTGNLLLQNGGTFTDAGYRLDINGTARVQGDVTFGTGFFYDNTNGRLRAGTSSLTTGVKYEFETNVTNDIFLVKHFSADLYGTGLNLAKARGTSASPSAVLSNDRLGAFGWRGYDGTSFAASALVIGFAGENYSSTNHGSYFSFLTTPNGSTTSSRREVLRIWGSANVSIQDGGTFTDVTSAQLQVNSTTKGFLPPRMTETQKNAITTPAAGLMVYDTTNNKLYVYDGTTWQAAW